MRRISRRLAPLLAVSAISAGCSAVLGIDELPRADELEAPTASHEAGTDGGWTTEATTSAIDASAGEDAKAPDADATVSRDSATDATSATGCQRKTCSSLNATCGSYDDGCGDTLNCGFCPMAPSGQTICFGTAPACCRPPYVCFYGNGEGTVGAQCNVTKQPLDVGCGAPRVCGCDAGLVCWCQDHKCTGADGDGYCRRPSTCADTSYCGFNMTDGAGGTMNCPCPAGKTCSATTSGAFGLCE